MDTSIAQDEPRGVRKDHGLPPGSPYHDVVFLPAKDSTHYQETDDDADNDTRRVTSALRVARLSIVDVGVIEGVKPASIPVPVGIGNDAQGMVVVAQVRGFVECERVGSEVFVLHGLPNDSVGGASIQGDGGVRANRLIHHPDYRNASSCNEP